MKKLKKIWFEISIFLAVLWDFKWVIIWFLILISVFIIGFLMVASVIDQITTNPEKIGEYFGRFVNGFNETKK